MVQWHKNNFLLINIRYLVNLNSVLKNKNHSLLVYQGFTVPSTHISGPCKQTFGYVNPWLSAGLLHLTVEYSCVEGMTISFLSKDRRVRKPRSLHMTRASRDVIESAQTDLKEPSKNIDQSFWDGQGRDKNRWAFDQGCLDQMNLGPVWRTLLLVVPKKLTRFKSLTTLHSQKNNGRVKI